MNEELKKLIDQLKSLRVPTAQVEAMAKSVRDAKEGTEEHNASLENMRARVRAIQEAADFAGESFSNLTAILRENLKELTDKEDSQKRINKATKGIIDLSRDLSYHEEEITDYSEKQLSKKIEIAKQRKKDMSDAALEQLQEVKGLGLTEDMNQAVFTTKANELVVAGKITREQANLFKEYKKGFPIVQGVIDKGEEQLGTQKRVNEALGVTGGLTKALAGGLQKLGIEGSALQHSIEDANSAMKKAAKDGSGKLKVALIGVGEVAKGAFKTLNDPAFIFAGIAAAVIEGDKHITDMQRSLGLSYDSAFDLTVQIEEFANASGDAFITTSKLTHAVTALTDQTGVFATTFTAGNLALYAQLTENLGIAGDAAGELVTTLELSGTSSKQFEKNLEKSVNTFNKNNKSGVTLKSVLNDVVNASSALQVTLGKTPGALAEAATAARGIGLELSQVEKISESLLDFQSSIESELEAQLLTGHSLNLARAREAALMGDMKTVSEEIGKQEAVKNAFATKNVIAQKAVAKSLGMSRNELAKMYKQEQLRTLGADKFASVYGKQELAALQARNAGQEFADSLAKLKDYAAQIFLPLAKVLSFVAEGLASIVASPVGKYFTIAAIGAIGVVKAVSGMSSAIKGASGMLKGFQDNWKSITGLFKSGSKAAAAAGETVANTASNAAGAASQGVSEMKEPKTSGSKVKEFLTNLAAGLKEMGSMKVLGGALNLIPASIGFIAFIPGMVGAKLMEKLDGAKLQESLHGLAKGLEEMGSTKVLGGALNLIAASAGFIAFIPGMIGVKLMEKVDGKKLQENLYGLAYGLEEMGKGKVALGAGTLLLSAIGFTAMIPAAAGMALFNLVAPATNKLLPKFGQALAEFGALMMTGVALLGLAALATSAIALGFALGLAAPGIEAAGTAIGAILTGLAPIVKVVGETIVGVFKSIPAIITAVADGFVNMFSAISMDNILPILALGPALLGASIGITAFAAALTGGSILSGVSSLMGGGIMSDLEALAAMSEPLALVGVSLTAIASGIVALSAALNSLETTKLDELKDLVITTAFAAPAIAATGAITELINGLTVGSEDSENKKLLEKVDRLIAAVETRQNIYLNPGAIEEAIVLGSEKF